MPVPSGNFTISDMARGAESWNKFTDATDFAGIAEDKALAKRRTIADLTSAEVKAHEDLAIQEGRDKVRSLSGASTSTTPSMGEAANVNNPEQVAGQYSEIQLLQKDIASNEADLESRKQQYKLMDVADPKKADLSREIDSAEQKLIDTRVKLMAKTKERLGGDIAMVQSIFSSDDPNAALQGARQWVGSVAAKQFMEGHPAPPTDSQEFIKKHPEAANLSPEDLAKVMQGASLAWGRQYEQAVNATVDATYPEKFDAAGEAKLRDTLGKMEGTDEYLKFENLRIANKRADAALAAQERMGRNQLAIINAKRAEEQFAAIKIAQRDLSQQEDDLQNEINSLEKSKQDFIKWNPTPTPTKKVLGQEIPFSGDSPEKIQAYNDAISDTDNKIANIKTAISGIKRQREYIRTKLGIKDPGEEGNPPPKEDSYKGHARPKGWSDEKWNAYKEAN